MLEKAHSYNISSPHSASMRTPCELQTPHQQLSNSAHMLLRIRPVHSSVLSRAALTTFVPLVCMLHEHGGRVEQHIHSR